MAKEKVSLDKSAVNAAFDAAMAAPVEMHPVYGGCARIYVVIYGVDAKTLNAVAAAAARYGMIFQRKAHYGLRNALYVGYDVATGREYCRGETIAKTLSAMGLPAYVEGCGD